MDNLGSWISGAVTVVGLVQWGKGLWKNAPAWLLALAVPALAILYSVSPEWTREAGSIVAVSQLGYETLFQPIDAALRAFRAKQES